MTGPRSGRPVEDTLDLLGIGLLAVAGTLVGLAGGPPSTLRVALGIPLVLFAPGYALVSALLPGRTIAGRDGRERQVRVAERLLLAVGLSVIVVPLVGLGLHYLGLGVGRRTLAVSVGLVTVLLVGVAAMRRLATDLDHRVRPGRGRLTDRSHWWRSDHASRRPRVGAILAVGLVLAAAGVGLAVATTDNGERYTEFSLLTANETGELVADDYPETLTVGAPTDLHVGITNREGEAVTYTVVVQLQRIDRSGRPTVTERFDLDRFAVAVDAGETIHRRHGVVPTVTGEGFRLTVLLYVEVPPSTPTRANAYRSLHLWVDVTPSSGAGRNAT